MIDEVLKNRIETALSSNNLMVLFEELEAEGLGQKDLENVFTDFLQSISQETNREEEKETIYELMEGITGYCNPSRHLFPPRQYEVHPGIIRFFAANEDQKLIVRFIFETTSFRVFHANSYENGELEIKSVEDLDFTKPTRVYLWNETISNEYSIHVEYFEHIQKTCWAFISDPTFFLHFGEIEGEILTPSVISYAFRHRPTQVAFDSIEPLRSYIDKLQVTTAIGIPVLQDANSLTKQGFLFKESAETRWNYELDSHLK